MPSPLLLGLLRNSLCKSWVIRTICLRMTTLALPSSNIILNSRMIKALAWLGMHALVTTWDIRTCHGLACTDRPWFWMRALVMAWNVWTCNGLMCTNMSTFDVWACHGLECMSLSRLGWERIKFGFPSLFDVPRRFPFCTLVQMQFTLLSNSHG